MRYGRFVRAALVATTLVGASAVRAAEGGERAGRELYLRYCGACHGPQARGDGIVASLMRPAPPDLTTIATRNAGEFSLAQVVKTIDGREVPHAHGEPRMPVWGTILGQEMGAHGTSPSGIERRVQGRILAIAEYLRGIQQR